jgi:hypothetical protein
MAIEGPLKELGIHDVFQLLDLSRKTGVLTVTSKLRHNQGTVYFDNGAVVYALVQSNPHPLGEVLLKGGKITEADLSRARDMQQQGDGRRLGEILVEIGSVGARELERQVRFQIEEVIFEVMNWREGYFSFEEGPLHEVPADATIRISTESVLMEGARRIDEWSRIERKIPNVSVVPSLAGAEEGDGGQLDLLPDEWEVLSTIDGERDIRAISSLIGRSDFDVAKTLFGLESARLITIAERGVAPKAPVQDEASGLEAVVRRAGEALDTGDIEAAQKAAEEARTGYPHEPAALLISGEVSLRAGSAPDAEEQLRRALRLDPVLTPAHRLLGVAIAQQGRHGEAIEWWERWLKFGEQAAGDPGEMEQVRAAVVAARALEAFLGRSSG